jgi:hypothetical protein
MTSMQLNQEQAASPTMQSTRRDVFAVDFGVVSGKHKKNNNIGSKIFDKIHYA